MTVYYSIRNLSGVVTYHNRNFDTGAAAVAFVNEVSHQPWVTLRRVLFVRA